MLEFTELDKPRIDIELYGTDTNISPIDQVHVMDEDSFDFTIVKTYPMAQVIDEHLDTIYGNIRFGGRRLNIPAPLMPTDKIESEEMLYISALLEAYSDELGIEIDTTESLKAYSSYFNHLNRQRKDYYSAETIRRFVIIFGTCKGMKN